MNEKIVFNCLPEGFDIHDFENDLGEPEPIQSLLPELPYSSAPQFTMYRFVKALKAKRILEIGTQEGATAYFMAMAQQEIGLPVNITCIDPFIRTSDNYGDDTLMVWKKNTAPFSAGIKLLKNLSGEVLPTMRKRKFDLIFVDGSHRYQDVANDLELVKGLLAENGLIVVHDTIYYREGPGKAAKEFVQKYNMASIEVPQKNYRGETCGWTAIWSQMLGEHGHLESGIVFKETTEEAGNEDTPSVL